MLDNDKLNRRLKKIFKMLKDKWRLTPYRIAVETGIPHSSLKYMVDEKFEWKLNHLLSIIEFLNRNGVKVSLTDLLDFNNKKSLSQIINDEKADFKSVVIRERSVFAGTKEKKTKKQGNLKTAADIELKSEAENLTSEISEIIKENRLYANSKITVNVKINGKNFDFAKSLNFGKSK